MVLIAGSSPLAFELPSNPAQTALLMIDWQGDFLDAQDSFIAAVGGSAGTCHSREAAPAAADILQAARQAKIRIIHTLESHIPNLHDLTESKFRRSRGDPQQAVIGEATPQGRMLVRGQACNGIVDAVAWRDGEVALHKPGKGAFCRTELDARLHGVTHLIVTGVTTECCVQSTLREANDRGFDCLVVDDATASCVPKYKTQAIDQMTDFGAIVACKANSAQVVQALQELAATTASISLPLSVSDSLVHELPTVDVSALMRKLHRSPYDRQSVTAECLECARALDEACRKVGFFYVTGHGLHDKIPWEDTRDLFALPHEAKMALRAGAGEGAGYEPSGAQVLDEGRLGNGIDGEQPVSLGDRKESYIVGKSAPSQRLDESHRIEGRWPDESANGPVRAGFKDRLVHYHDECEEFLRTLLRGIALGLGLAADMFDCYTTDSMTKVRLLRYPSYQQDQHYAAGAPGCGSHTDWGALTLLAQDDVGGLEVYCENKWVSAPYRDQCLLINVGDMLQLWTNGRYRSAPHRVTRPTLDDRDRYSIAVFYNCDADASIDPNYLEPNQTQVATRKLTAEQYILERVKGTYSSDASASASSAG